MKPKQAFLALSNLTACAILIIAPASPREIGLGILLLLANWRAGIDLKLYP